MVHTQVIKCRKFRVDIDSDARPDPIRVTVIGKKGTGSHHLTTTEVERLAVALVKAKGTVEARKKS
jgi:hypothetical protein